MKKDIKNKAIKRLKILEGQIRGLQRMVTSEKYCIDILTQSLAAKQALSGFEDLILDNHLSTHVVDQMKSGKSGKAIEEIMKIHKISKKKY
ncbi:MAG: metal-sensitive transcriptional regulator [bacterium]|nr:metal-sensitive transcriptional regulator [bacterium]